MSLRAVWSGLSRVLSDGKIKGVTVGLAEVFEVIRLKHQHPQRRYQYSAVNVLNRPGIAGGRFG